MPLSERVSLGNQLAVHFALEMSQSLETRPDWLASARRIDFTDSKMMLKQFFASVFVKELYGQAINDPRLYQDHDTDPADQLRVEISGALFQQLAWSYLIKRRPLDEVLSSDATLAVYKKIFPHTPVQRYPFGLDTLKEHVVPDGLVVDPERGTIREIAEYSLVKDADYFRRKVSAHRQMRQKVHFLCGDATIVFVVPHNIQIAAISADDDVEFLSMPISHHDFTRITDDFYREFAYPDSGATLVDVRVRIGQQQRRSVPADIPEALEDY